MTKQAARKRFLPKDPGAPKVAEGDDGFSHFTPRARNVIVASMNEAREAGNAERSLPATSSSDSSTNLSHSLPVPFTPGASSSINCASESRRPSHRASTTFQKSCPTTSSPARS